MDAQPAERLILIDPATGTPLSRLQTWLAIIVMLSGTTFVALVVTAVSPIMHQLSDYFGQGGHGKEVAYGIAIVPSVGIMLGGPVTGWVIEKVGSRNFLLSILIVFGVAGSAGLYLDNVWLLIATRFVLGVSAAGIVTGTLIMIGEYFEPVMRTRILGYQGAVGAVAALTIILSAGQLADWGGWRAPFAMYLLAFLIFIAAAIAIPKRPLAEFRKVKEVAPPGAIIALLPVITVITALFIGSFMPTIQISFLLADNGIMKPSTHSLVLGASALMVALGSAVYGPTRLRLGDRWTLRLCAGLIGAGIVVMGLARGAEVVALGCAISGMGTGLLNPQVNNMLITRAGRGARGRAVGMGYFARYAGDFLNPVVVDPLTRAFGIHIAFMLTGAAFVVGAASDLLARIKRSGTASA
ncbi:MAG: transporter [Rhodospirillales bacterium]|nr:transporter [Rhodospirillales bacterium]